MPVRGVKSPVAASKKEALVREILERVADKWTLLVIDALEDKDVSCRQTPGSALVMASNLCGVEDVHRCSRE